MIEGKTSLATRMREAFAARPGATRVDLARAAGVAMPSVTGWLNGATKTLRAATAMSAAAYLGVSAEWLATGRGPREPSSSAPALPGREVPLVPWDVASTGRPCEGPADALVACPIEIGPQGFALRMRGDSMLAFSGIGSCPEGCLLFFDPSIEPRSGRKILALLRDGSATCKILRLEDGRRWLQPANTHYPAAFDEFEIIATLIGRFELE